MTVFEFKQQFFDKKALKMPLAYFPYGRNQKAYLKH